jgi:phosphate uptake regulator
MPKKRMRKKAVVMPPDTERLLNSLAEDNFAEQQRRDERTAALYKAAIEELLTGEMLSTFDADHHINQALVDALTRRYADQIADRFQRHVEDVIRFDLPPGKQDPRWEVFGHHGK